MGTTTVDIEFRAKLNQLKAEMDSIPGLTNKAARQMTAEWQAQWKKAEQAGVDATKMMSKEGARLGKVAELVGGKWGEALRMVKGTAEIAEGGINTTTVALGALGVAVAVFSAAAFAVSSVLSDVEAYAEEIAAVKASGIITQDDVDNIDEAGRAYQGLKTDLSGFSVVLTSMVAPAFSDFSIGLAATLAYLETFSTEKATAAAHELYDQIHNIKKETTSGWVPIEGKRVSVDDVKAAEEAAAKQKAIDDRRTAVAQENARKRQEAVTREMMARLDLETYVDEAAQASEESERKAMEQLQAFGAASVQASVDAVGSLENIGDAMAVYLERSDTLAQDEIAKNNEVAQTRIGNALRGLEIAARVNDSMMALADDVFNHQIAKSREGSEEQKRLMRKQFAVHKAMAIASATIDMAAAIVSALGTSGNIYAGIALAVAAGVTGSTEIGLIAAQKPTFHTGGAVGNTLPNAPDETFARLRAGEGVLSPTGMSMLDRLNRGDAGGGSSPVVVPVYGHRVFDAVTANAVGRRTSTLARALRSVRKNRAGHR